jgi:glucose-6-phosphate isomerase
MSVIRPKLPEDPIAYEPPAGETPGWVSTARLDAVAVRLEQVREAVLCAADFARPERLLDAYNTGGGRAGSQLFAILQAARRIRDMVDRVIVLEDGCGGLAARAVFESCVHPCHNELSRGERGGRPRLFFLGPDIDNDALQGLLDVVSPAGKSRGRDLFDQWAVIVGSQSGSTVEMAAATRLLLAALSESVGGDRIELAHRVVAITGDSGGLASVATSLGCSSVFTIAADVGAGSLVFTPLGLLPAAVAGIDVVRLLQGASAMNRRFREAQVSENPVLHYASRSRLMAEQGGLMRALTSRTSQLAAVCRWHERLAAQKSALLTTQLVVREPRRDPLVVPPLAGCQGNEDGLDQLVGTPWCSLPAAQAGHDRPQQSTDTILLPRVDEHSIGQLLQFLVLANLVDGVPTDHEPGTR